MCKFANNGKHSRIDKCIKHLIANLKVHGVATVASCCGHGKYPMSIIVMSLKSTREHFDMVSNTTIPRKSRFYKRDKQGYYYIPEVVL